LVIFCIAKILDLDLAGGPDSESRSVWSWRDVVGHMALQSSSSKILASVTACRTVAGAASAFGAASHWAVTACSLSPITVSGVLLAALADVFGLRLVLDRSGVTLPVVACFAPVPVARKFRLRALSASVHTVHLQPARYPDTPCVRTFRFGPLSVTHQL
jgi:hypothetical protein